MKNLPIIFAVILSVLVFSCSSGKQGKHSSHKKSKKKESKYHYNFQL